MKKIHSRTTSLFLLLLMVISKLPFVRAALSGMVYLLPCFWIFLSLFICLILPGIYLPGRKCTREAAAGYAVSGAFVYLAIRFLIGLFLKKVAASPYDLSPEGIFYNVMTVFPELVVGELIRVYLIGAWRKAMNRKLRIPALALLIIVFAILEINFRKTGKLQSTEQIFIYGAVDVLPVLIRQILLTTLAVGGGAEAAILYAGISAAFQRFFPFLPELTWLAESVVGIVFPLMYTHFVYGQCQILNRETNPAREEPVAGYAISLGLAVAFSWFCVGVFPIYPSVILTGSMEPGIMPGDVVLIHKMQSEEEIYDLEKGEIINFKRDNITITHRITDIELDEAGNIFFRTKGDNNDAEDAPLVAANDLKGKIEGVVPKAGIGILLINQKNEIPEGVTDGK